MKRSLPIIVTLALTASLSSADELDDAIANSRAGDYQAAIKVFREYAEQGDAKAQSNLGAMYDMGLGVAFDTAEAAKWYRRAAEQGEVFAQYNLGHMYRSGQLASGQDFIRALMWFNIALTNGHEPGEKAQDSVKIKMTSEEISEALGRARSCLSSGYRDCD